MKLPIFLTFILIIFLFFVSKFVLNKQNTTVFPLYISPTQIIFTPTPQISLANIPVSKILSNDYHIYQTFNNCGPAALSMALSYYGVNESQQTLGQQLRPYQNPQGDNDDKSVTLEELGEKAKQYGLIPYHRPNGNIELVKLFIAYDIPVVARTLLREGEDIGHYRVVKGYDDESQFFIQDDSLQGKNLSYAYESFTTLWKTFNYEYLVLVPNEKKQIAETILAEDTDSSVAWTKAVKNALTQLETDPDDVFVRFNLSVGLFNIGDYQRSVEEFEKVEARLPFRTLWYQIEPIQAYFELGNYQRVFQITDKVLNNWNRAFSELYFIRGQIYQKQGNSQAASQELEKAIFYNTNYVPAQDLLETL